MTTASFKNAALGSTLDTPSLFESFDRVFPREYVDICTAFHASGAIHSTRILWSTGFASRHPPSLLLYDTLASISATTKDIQRFHLLTCLTFAVTLWGFEVLVPVSH